MAVIELWQYQNEAVDFIGKHKKMYLAFEPGMGKTLASLAGANKHGKKHILIIAEKNEVVNSQNFKKEVETHFPELHHISLREHGLEYIIGATRAVCSINPDGLIKLDIDLIKRLFDFVIIDEATLAKTTTTKRFKIVRKICKEMEYVVLLSGTPMMNGASEIYAPLLLLEHPLAGDGTLKSKMAFETVFAGGHNRKIRNTGKWFQDYVWWAKGANYVRELRYLIGDKFFFKQKMQTDVFKKKVRIIENVPMTLPWLVEYKNAWDEYIVKARKRDVDMDNVMELRNLIENGQVYQVNSRWKARKVAHDIAYGKYDKRRIVVFSMFIETDEILKEELTRQAVSFRTFDELNKWKSGTEQVLIGRIKAHGKGGNVPEASVVLFVDMDFVPANNVQAECRIDRPEQQNDMMVVYYITEGEDIIDAHVRHINQDKMRKIDEFMRPFTEEELADMPEKIATLKEKYKKQFGLLHNKVK